MNGTVDQEEKTVKKQLKTDLAVAGLCFTLTAGMLTGCSGNSGKAIITLDGQKQNMQWQISCFVIPGTDAGILRSLSWR